MPKLNMRTKLLFAVILVISIAAFLLADASPEIHNPPVKYASLTVDSPFDSIFFVGAFDYGAIVSANKYHDSMYFNLWHQYPQYDPKLQKGWTNRAPADSLTADINNYGVQIEHILDENHSAGMKTLMNRVKIEYLAMGQRSDYKCTAENYNPDYWFYVYNHHDPRVSKEWKDETTLGNHTWVRYCVSGQFSPGFVVDGLKANREQINYYAFSSRYMSDQLYPWYIMPKIRIDTAFANNPANRNTNICRIEILRFDGKIIKSVDLKPAYFLDNNGRYTGKYLEEYNFPSDVNLRIDPIADSNHPDEPGFNTNPFNPDKKGLGDMSCKVDFRVWWYGTCNMWIDYIRVENQIAHELFRGERDNWIGWEVNLAKYHNAGAQFYVEEFEFNMVPCMSYVARKIREFSGGRFNLMCAYNCGEYIFQMPNWWQHVPDIDYLSRNLIDTLRLTEFIDFAYPFKGYKPMSIDNTQPDYVPNTLPASSYDSTAGRFCISTKPADYDTWLQHYIDRDTSFWNDYFTKYMKHGDAISKLRDIPFVTMIQTHLWYTPGYILREPTNEETRMMVNLSVSYGARSVLYFIYSSWGEFGSGGFARGLTGGYPSLGSDPRTANVYGQNKWAEIKDINRKLTAWGPTLMSFDNVNRHSYIYRLDDERSSLVSDTYFRWMVTGKPGKSGQVCPHGSEPLPPPEAGLVYDCTADTYLQATVFRKRSGGQNELYFMIVNRRCSPYIDSTTDERNGGRRKVKVIFDTDNDDMSAANKWRVTDVANPGWTVTFDKRANQYIDLGWFMPAEGRLYKMVPAQ